MVVFDEGAFVPVTLLPADWTAMMTEFKRKHGIHVHDDRLPAQSCFENFGERLADGTFNGLTSTGNIIGSSIPS